jgi:multimeric flavodoxin WrbA
MSTRVVILSTSLRENSNSHALAEAFARGAEEAGHTVERISLRGKQIAFCRGCLACQSLGHCVIDDDARAIEESVLRADVVVWATPIYYYEMAGQMKTLIDRMNALYPKDYRFRDVYFLASAAEEDASVPERAISGLQGWIDCYEKAALKGYVFCGGVNDPGDIAGHEKLRAAYALGSQV